MFPRLLFFVVFLSLTSCASATMDTKTKATPTQNLAKDYKEYVKYFEQVYKTFDDHYYLEPNLQVYNNFLEKFRTKIYTQLAGEGKSNDYVKWRSASFLVDDLKSKEDRFSQFYPPKPAEKFQKEALGQLVDLGIEGKKVDAGYLITRIEPRSDAYEKGLREEDILVKLNGKPFKDMSVEDIEKELSPLKDSKVNIDYLSSSAKQTKSIQLISREYFKQTIFLRPVAVPGVFCLEIPKFNRMSGEDLYRFLKLIDQYNPRGLVLDLRGNPGGPPLAAREMAGFFLKGNEEFTHFQKRGIPPDALDVPVYDEAMKFKAPIAILVDKDSGSASELFSGVMQFRKRAIVIGENTAGQMLLKTMFPVGDDGSMIALVTARGYLPDGTPFSFDGVTPDQVITNAPKEGLINLAATILVLKGNK